MSKEGENNLKLDTEAGEVPNRIYIKSKPGDDEELPTIDLSSNPFSIEDTKNLPPDPCKEPSEVPDNPLDKPTPMDDPPLSEQPEAVNEKDDENEEGFLDKDSDEIFPRFLQD